MTRWKNAWISGASTGIGRSVTRMLVDRGVRVGMTARNAEKLHAFMAEFPVEQRARLLALPCDVTDRACLEAAYTRLKQAWGVPDLVLANAGTHINMPARGITWEDCGRVITINLLGAVSMITLALPGMIERGSGHIAGVGSLSSYRGLPWAAAYGASKAGLNNFLQSLRFDVETHGISVTAINPGFVDTPLTARNPFPMPMRVSADRAARYIVNGLEKKRMEVHFPPLFSWQFKLLRILPYPLYHALIRKVTGSAARKE